MAARSTTLTAPKQEARASPGTEALQRRMKVGAAGDRFEREADRIADHVVGSSALPAAAPPPVISPLGLQREALDEERETGPEEPAQLKAGPEKPAREDELSQALNAQRDANGHGAQGAAAPSGVESSIQAMRSGPAPGLAPPLRNRMENKMGVDLGGVRVHSGTSAGKAADALNARAFTVGQDMFFGRSQYDPVSTSGQRLIAHEAAHTVQQRGGSAGVQRIQRATAKDKSSAKSETKSDTTAEETLMEEIPVKGGSVDLRPAGKHRGTVKVAALELPTIDGVAKGVAGGAFTPVADSGFSLPTPGSKHTLPPHGKRPSKKAMDVWVAHGKTAFVKSAKSALDAHLATQKDAAPLSKAGSDVYVLYFGKDTARMETALIGNSMELSAHDSILRPQFSMSGTKNAMDADHILEWQLGGVYGAENMQMLKRDFNQNAGPRIDGRINSQATAVVNATKKFLEKNPGVKTPRKLPEDYNEVKASWVIEFATVKASSKLGRTTIYWPRGKIEAGEQVKHFKAMTATELAEQGFVFDPKIAPKVINVFPSASGGWVIPFKVKKGGKELALPPRFYGGMQVLAINSFTPPTAGNVSGNLAELQVKYSKRKKKGSKEFIHAEKPITLRHDPKLGFGAYISRESIAGFFSDADFPGLSPLNLRNTRVTPDGMLAAEGDILSSKALLPQLNIPIQLLGENVFVDFPIPSDKLKFGPVDVNEVSLTLGIGPDGLFMSGGATILIDKLGQGRLTAKTTKKDTLISGKFAFNFSFVESAEVAAEYSLAKDDFKAKGTLKVKKGTLPGVESGTIEVNATRQTFGVTGTLQLGGALTGITITVGYTPKTGILIEGKDIALPVDRLPGVSDAKVTVRAQRSPDTGEWLFSGAGSAALKAPGASGTLTIAVKGDQVYFDGRMDLAKGPATGFIQVTATNLQMDESGKPIEGGATGPLQIWGNGQASIAFGKVLTGTAGIAYTREGKIIITGEIALPPTVDLFKRVDYSKKLLEIAPPDFPIWGVKLGPVGIGIFAFVDARLDFLAYVGPGQLRDTKVNATMDLDKPSEATVEGKAQFYVPAFAGFRLDLGGGLKAQVAVAYVKGRVGLDGMLGLGVEGKIDVGVKWNATDGLAFNANANVEASPKFELGVNASVTAGVDLPWPVPDIDHTWGPWRKKLGEFGPNMELSADFPVAWSEKEGLDFDLGKIKITKPKLDAKSLMKSAFDTLV